MDQIKKIFISRLYNICKLQTNYSKVISIINFFIKLYLQLYDLSYRKLVNNQEKIINDKVQIMLFKIF